jgi:hypothetical protein
MLKYKNTPKTKEVRQAREREREREREKCIKYNDTSIYYYKSTTIKKEEGKSKRIQTAKRP